MKADVRRLDSGMQLMESFRLEAEGYQLPADSPSILVQADYEQAGLDVDDPKKLIMDQYTAVLGVARCIERLPEELDKQYFGRVAKCGLETFLEAMRQSSGMAQDLFAAQVRRFALQVTDMKAADIDRIIPAFGRAAIFVHDILGCYIDVITEHGKKDAAENLASHIDRLLPTFIGVDITFIGHYLGLDRAGIAASNRKIRTVIARRLRNEPEEVIWHEWSNEYSSLPESTQGAKQGPRARGVDPSSIGNMITINGFPVPIVEYEGAERWPVITEAAWNEVKGQDFVWTEGSENSSLTADEDWKKLGLCAEVDPELFFVEKGEGKKAGLARWLCGRCEVRVECLQSSLDNKEEHGIWGGVAPKMRRKLLSQLLQE